METENGRTRIADVVNIVGSVASITGVSMLWMRDKLNNKTTFIEVPIMALWSLFALALLVVSYYAFRGVCMVLQAETRNARVAACIVVSPFVGSFAYGLAFYSFQLALILVRDIALPR